MSEMGRSLADGAIDNYADDPPRVLVRRAADIASQHAMRIHCPNDRDRG